MVKPLTFKGDKPKKRKARNDDESSRHAKAAKASTSTDLTRHEDEATEDQTWVSADTPADVAGPVVLILPSDPPTCVATDANGKVFASEVENMIEGDAATAEPHDVRQVWVATRVAGTEGLSFKGHHGKYVSVLCWVCVVWGLMGDRYLTSDNHGLVSAATSAISHYESFLAIPSQDIPGLFSLQTGGGDKETFLCVKEGKKGSLGQATVDVRGDATAVSFETSVRIRMQARFKPRIRANKESKALEKISQKELEAAVGRRLEDHEVRRLRRARREGNFHEEVLDVRVKGKHDKFA